MDDRKCPCCGQTIKAEEAMCSSCREKRFGVTENEIIKQEVQINENDNANPVRPVVADVEVPPELAMSFNQRSEMLSKLKKQKETYNNTIRRLNYTKKTLESDFKSERPQQPQASWELIKIVAEWYIFILGILLLVHGVSWVFGRSLWSTVTTVFRWGLWISIGALLLNIVMIVLENATYKTSLKTFDELISTKEQLEKEVNEQEKNILESQTKIQESFKNDIWEIIGIPISAKAIPIEQANALTKACLKFYSHKNTILTSASPAELYNIKMDLANQRLKLFYQWSVKGEAEEDTYEAFNRLYKNALKSKNWNILRSEPKDKDAAEILANLQKHENLLNDNRMDPIVDSLRDTIDRDTTNIFGGQNVNKLSEKTMDLKDLYEAAIAEYDELEELTWDINYLLQFVRICAYRNIYLGLELMTMIRENAGGKTLTTEKEYTQVDVEVANMDIKASELSTNITDDFATAFFETASQSFDYLDNDRIRKDLYKDPKKAAAYAAGAVAVAAVRGLINYFEDRSKKIEANMEIQKNMVKNVRVVVDGYSAGQGALLREIEIIKAIKKANDGFMAIYEPLRKKVFETNDISSVSKKDIQQMAIATSNYNKISTSKL